jgi:hypothetical protein
MSATRGEKKGHTGDRHRAVALLACERQIPVVGVGLEEDRILGYDDCHDLDHRIPEAHIRGGHQAEGQ